jgi:hypothetical protein
MVHRFATVREGAFAWTRDRAGEYHLGRIAGGLRSGRNFQRTHDAEAERQTAEIWLRERGESA